MDSGDESGQVPGEIVRVGYGRDAVVEKGRARSEESWGGRGVDGVEGPRRGRTVLAVGERRQVRQPENTVPGKPPGGGGDGIVPTTRRVVVEAGRTGVGSRNRKGFWTTRRK